MSGNRNNPPELLARNTYIVNPAGDRWRVQIEDGDSTLTFVPQGFQVAQKISGFTVTTVAQAIPASALANRNSISIQNKGATTVYIGPDTTVTADDDPTTGGWEIGAGETLNEPVSDSVTYFAIVSAGTAFIKIRELS